MRDLNTKASLHFARKLKIRSLASLFINKCKSQMQQQSYQLVTDRRKDQAMQVMNGCFHVLKRKWKIRQFRVRWDSIVAQKVLYQWSIYCKLDKIRKRYKGGPDLGAGQKTGVESTLEVEESKGPEKSAMVEETKDPDASIRADIALLKPPLQRTQSKANNPYEQLVKSIPKPCKQKR